ncbi:Mss4-like protein [Favolaschia claudopus]|uniref:Mss4-like protein n=1 Tax=Favolaschia claudopus TaxID=2862362 RepID=A0AAW0BGH9_9AGAR
MSPEPTIVERSGLCLCRKVRFIVTGEPFSYVVCHCNNCKKFTGSAFMTNAKISVKEGQEFVRKYNDSDTISGNTIVREFCSQCGTCLFLSSPQQPDWISVCPGTVEGQEWVPRREKFVEDNPRSKNLNPISDVLRLVSEFYRHCPISIVHCSPQLESGP